MRKVTPVNLEIQHVIQKIEGFAQGSSPTYWAARDAENGSVKRRLEQERESIFRSLSRDEQNQYARYQELERELERLSDAEDGTEDGERYLRYDRESDELYLKLWEKDWFQRLGTLDRKLGSGLGEEYARLYRNTAGEIEARDTQRRRTLTAEERRNTAPDIGDGNTVFAEGNVEEEYIDRDVTEEEVQEGIRQVADMEAVADVTGKEFAKSEVDLVTQVTEFFESIGNEVFNPQLGDVVLDRKGVKDDLGHGIGRKKAAAFAAVPDVLEQGRVIDYQKNWKGRGYDTAVVAAPVTIGGAPYLEGIVLTRGDQTNRFYVHEVLTTENGAQPFKTGTSSNRGLPGGDAPSVVSLLQKVREVNFDFRKIDINKGIADGDVPSTENGRGSLISSNSSGSVTENEGNVNSKFSAEEEEDGPKSIELPYIDNSAEESEGSASADTDGTKSRGQDAEETPAETCTNLQAIDNSAF